MNIVLQAVLAASLPLGVQGAAMQEEEAFKSQELLKEMQTAQRSNLDRAMADGMKDARTAAANVLALADSGRVSARGAAAELAPAAKSGAGSASEEGPEDWLEALSLSADLLEAKAEAFREKAAAAQLETADLEGELLARRKAAYRSADRKADQRLAEKYFEEALRSRKGRPPALDPDQQAALASAGDILSELKSAQANAQRLLGVLAPKSLAGRKAAKRVARLGQEAQFLEMETQLMELGLKMAEFDEESFESE